jgi:hypothetical protein
MTEGTNPDTIDDVVKRERSPAVLIYYTDKEREAIKDAAKEANVSMQVFIHDVTLASTGAHLMILPPDLSRLVRSEAKRRKLKPDTLLAMWIGAAAGKDE